MIICWFKGGGGGGGGGGQAVHFRKKGFELGVGGEGQAKSRHFRVVLGPCETSEKNWDKNQDMN